MTQVHFKAAAGAHEMVRFNYPLKRGQYTLGPKDPSPFTLYHDGQPLWTQCDVVTRYEDGSASMVQLRARLDGSEQSFTLDLREEHSSWGDPDLSMWDEDVLGVAASRYGIMFVVEDYFGNRYYAPLTRDLSELMAGARTAKFDVYGPNTIRAELPEYVVPAPETIFPRKGQQMRHFGMVSNFLTTHAGSSVMELDFKWANASGDDPTGLLNFKSLTLLVPQNFSVLDRVHLPTFQPAEDEMFGYTAYHLIAPNSDGRMHLLGQNQQARFRLLVFEHDARDEAEAIQRNVGWGACPDAWGEDGRLGFNVGGFPVPRLDHLDTDWWSVRSFQQSYTASWEGAAHRDPLGNTLGGDGRVGPFFVIGGSYGGQTAGTGKEFSPGIVEMRSGEGIGVAHYQYVADGYHHRMEDGCIWDASCRPHHELVDAYLSTPEWQRWRYFDAWQKRSWSSSDPNASRKDQDAPFGFSDVQSLHDLSDVDFTQENAQVIPESAMASYWRRKLYDPRNDFNGYMRIDAQHLIRAICADEALIYLDNDALAKHDVEELAFCARLMYFDGEEGRLYERANPGTEGIGTDLGRGPSHCAHAWLLAWHISDGAHRMIWANLLDLYAKAHERNMTRTGSANVYKGGKTLTDFHPSGAWAVMRTNEVAYACYALEGIREAMPSLADRVVPTLHRTLTDYAFTHAWMKTQGGQYQATTWTHVAMANKSDANDPGAYFGPGEHPSEQYQVSAGSFGANLLLAVGLKNALPLAFDRLANMYGDTPKARLEAKGWEWLVWTRGGLLAMVQKLL